MRQLLTTCALTTVLLVSLLPAALWSKDIPTVRVAAFNYYPAIFLGTDNQVRGFYVDMLDEIAAREQIRFEYVFGSWNDGLERLRSGEVDLITSAAYTQERATFMDYGQQVLLTVWGELYIHQEVPTVSITGFEDQPIAVMRGDHNARSFKDHLGKFGISSRFVEYADFDGVFAAIKAKQVSGGVVNSVFGDAAAKRYEVHSSGIAFNPFNIYFAAAKGQNAELLRLLDNYLLDWRNDSASVYYHARLKWGAGQEPEEVIPDWVVKVAVVAALVFLSGLVFIVLLRHRVNMATHEVQESNNMIRLLLDSTAEGIYGLDLQGICTFCNAACVQILGYDNPDQLIGRNMHDLIHHSHADGTAIPTEECDLLKGLDRKVHCDSEMFWRAGGSSFPVEYWSYPIRQENQVIGMVVSFVDITERKRTEEALRVSEERFRRMVNEAPLGIAIVDSLNARFYLVNPAMARITGRSMDELNRIDWVSITHPDDIQPDKDKMAAMNAGKIPGFQMEKRYLLADGQYSWVNITVAPMYVADKSKPRHLLMVADINDRKRVEKALWESEERFRKMFRNHSAVMLLIKPETGEILDANQAAEKFYRYSREELLCLNISQINTLTPDVVAAERQAAVEGNRNCFIFPHRLADGEIRTVEVHSSPISVNSATLLFSIVHDITERKRIEQDLIEQKNAYQSILSASHDGFLVLDTQGQILDGNPAYLTFSGYDRDELLSLHISELDANENAEEAARHINKVMTQGSDLFESVHQRKDGSVWSTEVSTTYSPLNEGRFFTFLRDITERKQAQWALEQKNQELEQFVYSVTHDIKSPLVTVKTFVSILRQDLLKGDQPQINEDLNYIDQAADKMQQLLDALLRYSRIGRIDTPAQTVSADQQVQNCLTTLAGILQQQQVHVSTSKLSRQLHGDPLHFGQVWQNLIENAVKYRGDQAHPCIEIGATQQGHEVVFYVRDNGMGIEPKHNERIFNLFSQLNPGSDGSGLGLALVKKIVSIYQGRIWVESTGANQGSCFKFTLPEALNSHEPINSREQQ